VAIVCLILQCKLVISRWRSFASASAKQTFEKKLIGSPLAETNAKINVVGGMVHLKEFNEGFSVLIATWNLNHRIGKTRFRPEAARAIATLQADTVMLTEYYPQDHQNAFRAELTNAGWPHMLASENVGEIANRILIVSRFALEPFPLSLPQFDRQFPSNILCVTVPKVGVRVLGLRIPAYARKDRPCLLLAWDWLETILAGLKDVPTAVVGDLNANVNSSPANGGAHFRRILADGWRRAIPGGPGSFFGRTGRPTAIDHILCNDQLCFSGARYVTEVGGWHLVGRAGALSDHAALVASIFRRRSPDSAAAP